MEPEDFDVVLSEQYDPGNGVPMSVYVVRLVAIASDARPVDLDPLGRHVDADALDRLYGPALLADADTSVSVQFAYEGYTVVIEADGTVKLLVTLE